MKDQDSEARVNEQPKSDHGDLPRQTPTGEAPTFQKELKNLINRHSVENDSDTPDFILASFLVSMLQVFGATAKWRDEWYEPKPAVAEGAPPAPQPDSIQRASDRFYADTVSEPQIDAAPDSCDGCHGPFDDRGAYCAACYTKALRAYEALRGAPPPSPQQDQRPTECGGCHQPFAHAYEVYRCADCEMPFHRDCLRSVHFREQVPPSERHEFERAKHNLAVALDELGIAREELANLDGAARELLDNARTQLSRRELL